MPDDLALLCSAAALIGFGHTLIGPDHYLPFVAMSRAGGWSIARTLTITVVCGVGHVLGSVTLGFAGVALGIAVFRLEQVESVRGDIAGWLLLAMGTVYFAWGVRRATRNRPHTHRHVHPDGSSHSHEHRHADEHVHVHDSTNGSPEGNPGGETTSDVRRGALTPWVLFTIFLFGPCEPLIPLVMYPAAKGSLWHVALVTAVFGVVTLATMVAIVTLTYYAVGVVKLGRFGRYGHAAAGFVVLLCGAAIKAGW